MSLDHAKTFIIEKLQSDADFRARVADFILYRDFLGSFEDLKNLGEEATDATPCHERGAYCSYLSGHDERKCPFTDELHGYENWTG